VRRLVLGIVLAATSLVFASAAGASTILYTTIGDGKDPGAIWSVRPDGSGARALRRKVPFNLSGIASISRDGKHIFCVCRGREIDSMKVDGSQFTKVGRLHVETEIAAVTLGPEGEPFWPKGSHLMTAGRDGGHPHSIVKLRFAVPQVAIPRRGRRIALSERATVYMVPLGGGPRTEIYHSAIPGRRYVSDMSWSADGKKLVFVDYPEQEKYETPTDPKAHAFVSGGGSVHELPLSQEAIGEPMFSPDSTRLASIGEDHSIFVSSLGGGPVKQIVKGHCSPETMLCSVLTDLLGWVP
jgi:Tol biopolymer transport system component